ncbi:MAG: acyl-CoA dehydrogenase family protein [Proteobacteria bacterium]|nr:acyl-CoA dehydrogenase family protein [Pseudomonadota bacterium]
MDFEWPERALAIRKEICDFLDRELPPWWDINVNTLTAEAGAAHHDFCRDFSIKLAKHGYLTPHWPREYGGRDAGAWELFALSEVLSAYGDPRGQQYMNVNWIGPAIMRYGTTEQKEYFLGRMSRGELQFCQGFSEPGAGSDLAALRTSAIRDGDTYVVNGQKVWTSYAVTADYCFLLVRTDPHSRGPAGLSTLLVPMGTPGLTVRPISNLMDHGFCELFFDDCRVPIASRLGAENQGWKVAMDALSFERIGMARYARALKLLDEMIKRLRTSGELDNPVTAERVGQAIAACHAARALAYRVIDARARSLPPGPEGNVARLASIWAEQIAVDAIFDLTHDAVEAGSLGDQALKSALPSGHATGSIEVNLGIIAKHGLGLVGTI